MPGRAQDTAVEFGNALQLDPNNAALWAMFGFLLACRLGKHQDAEAAFRRAADLAPDEPSNLRNLGVLLYCHMLDTKEGLAYLSRASALAPSDAISDAIVTAVGESNDRGLSPLFVGSSTQPDFWDALLELVSNYPPFGKILAKICDLLQNRDESKGMARLFRAVAFAQLGDFPRASVALEDALVGDPIDLLERGRKALEVFFAAAVRNERVRECIELLDKKGWKDAWRPIYEALKAVESGSAEYLKRIAVEIRDPAMVIIQRIAPELAETEHGPRRP
jgi:tetratricopeptide (TPR) repeat protein